MSIQSDQESVLDFLREQRTGLAEAVLCSHKRSDQIESIIGAFEQRETPCLLTRLSPPKVEQLSEALRCRLDYDPLSETGFYPNPGPPERQGCVAIVSAGTSDAPICREAQRTLAFYGVDAALFQDVGVAGLWRIAERLEALRRFPILIVAAGMEGAIFSVLGGLVDSVLIAVPTSVGYGVSAEGRLALHSALGGCAPGIVAVNVDNGFGAACAALRILNRFG